MLKLIPIESISWLQSKHDTASLFGDLTPFFLEFDMRFIKMNKWQHGHIKYLNPFHYKDPTSCVLQIHVWNQDIFYTTIQLSV